MVHSGKAAGTKQVSHSYIVMVQHLIEKCLIMYMDLEGCCKSLAKYAHVQPAITIAVWKGLEKENSDFFKHYLLTRTKNRAKAFDAALEAATARLCSQTLGGDMQFDARDGQRLAKQTV
ncbi:Plant protein 1589 of unknown function [Klebsormidium nitens]|uniref:Uncharacterized protein n=1 Tax=Klebsormidium nitens TaxID=105231 RepID=A0A1Y1IFB7_KLENI|nr:Plant protein 1589 of unknown function [Klebsormidium nitens]|eukprot:GAQ86798.1 Plant protein 1589 of unknown function [Klebsormidium nitens]